MKYNPKIHNRQSTRLKGYDYSQVGLYFITLCCANRANIFGGIEMIKEHSIPIAKMVLNNAGKIAEKCWVEIPVHFPNVVLHEYVIMPNHVHGIIEIVKTKNIDVKPGQCKKGNARINKNKPTKDSSLEKSKDAKCGTANNNKGNGDVVNNTEYIESKFVSPSKTIGSMVRGFKIGVTKWMRQNTDIHDVWQRNYYDVIIRDELAYYRIAQYIRNNPAKWLDDKFYSK